MITLPRVGARRCSGRHPQWSYGSVYPLRCKTKKLAPGLDLDVLPGENWKVFWLGNLDGFWGHFTPLCQFCFQLVNLSFQIPLPPLKLLDFHLQAVG